MCVMSCGAERKKIERLIPFWYSFGIKINCHL